MAKASPMQTGFNSGEWSPLMGGAIDIKQRGAAVAEMLNLIPLKQGAATRRGGNRFVAEIKDSSKDARLINFEFNTTQAYELEFGENYIRFYKDRGLILNTAQNITAITKANPAVVTYTGADPTNGQQVYINGVLGMTEVNGRRFTVANVNAGANTFELSGVNSSSYTTYTSAGTFAIPYEIVSTYTEAQLSAIKFVQSADVVYLVHPSHPPRALTRTAHTSWTLTDITFQDGPYLPTNTKSDNTVSTTLTITPSAVSGAGITLTASAALFAATDVGRLVRVKHASKWGNAIITGYTSATVVTATVNNAFAAITASTDWRLGLYNSAAGYPSCITFFQDRIVLAGCPFYPNRVDFGVTAGYTPTTFNFAPTTDDGVTLTDNITVTDNSAFSRTLSGKDVNSAVWLAEDSRGLLAGTVRAEWLISPDDLNGTLVPSNARQKRISKFGSRNIQPMELGNATVFIQKSGRKVAELSYLFERDGFQATDLTLFAEHITRSQVIDITYQQDPINCGWLPLTNGNLVGMTYLPEQKVVAFHKHTIGGTDAFVRSVSVIPAPDGERDDLWMIVKRTIGGTTKRYVEYQERYYEDDQAQEDALCMDSGLSYDGSPTTTITGLWHLEGETVKLLVDGATHPDVVVSMGTITLVREGSVVQVGLSNTWRLKTLPLEAGAQDGTAQGKIKRITKLAIRLLNTLGLKYGNPKTPNVMDTEQFSYGTQMGTATPLFTGDIIKGFPGGYDTDGAMVFTDNGPHPITFLGLMPQVVTQDGG
jgi:hypothetical protein